MTHSVYNSSHFLAFIHFNKSLLFWISFEVSFKVHSHIDSTINSFRFSLAIVLAIFKCRLAVIYFYFLILLDFPPSISFFHFIH